MKKTDKKGSLPSQRVYEDKAAALPKPWWGEKQYNDTQKKNKGTTTYNHTQGDGASIVNRGYHARTSQCFGYYKENFAMGMGMGGQILMAARMLFFVWRMWPVAKHWLKNGPKGSSSDWLTYALLMGGVVVFVLILMKLV